MNLSLTLGLFATSSLILILILLTAGALMFLRRRIIPCWFGPSSTDQELGGPPAPNSRVADEHEPPIEDNAKKKKFAIQKLEWDEIESLTSKFTVPVIGEGGFSTVYLAQLPDTTLAALKVQRSSERLHRAFLQELDVLLHVDHPNIVRLYGYSHNQEEGVLVFEYVPNGTLHQKLHPNSGLTASETLTWSQRMSILFQIASAIEYLHDGCDLQIVHGDITASNVLLDGHLNSKLCDFGFARMGFSAAVKPAAAGHMVGSPGYADPHYLRTGIISKKSDVYSFGVLMLEMISGIPAVRSEDDKFLTAVIREGGSEKAVEMVDPKLGANFDVGELAVMVEVAGRCIGDRPGPRPSIAEIIRIMRENIAGSISTAGS